MLLSWASSGEGNSLLKASMVFLVLLWAVGLLTHHTMGGFINALLVLALVLWLITIVRADKPSR